MLDVDHLRSADYQRNYLLGSHLICALNIVNSKGQP